MTEQNVQEALEGFAAILATGDEHERAAWISRARMLAMAKAEPEAFKAPIRTLGEYMEWDIPTPPVLVEPAILCRGSMLCTVGRAGKGKYQPHYSSILTPTRWTSMGAIQVGDKVVDPQTGAAVAVTNKFPQGVQDVYRVSFSDGSSAEAGLDHLWAFKDRHGVPRVQTTAELVPGVGVPLTVPFDWHDELERPLDPWVVGFLLGDGALTQGLSFSTADAAVVTKMQALLPTSTIRYIGQYDYYVKGALALDCVRQLGMNVGAYAKRVPNAYMRGTAASRLEVLRGLMDSDGHGSGQFCSMSKGLVEDVIYLTRSLGGTASLHAQRPNGAWRSVVSLPITPFTLQRKIDLWSQRRGRLDGYKYVRKVELIGREESSCIQLDSESGLYVTDDFTVTHNTQMNLNRLMRWACGEPLFTGLKNKQELPILGPTKPLRTLVIENEGAAGMFHRQIGMMLNADGYLTKEQRELANENILIWGDGGFSGLKLDDEKQLNAVRAGVEEWKPDVVFVEPFRGLWRGEENSSTDMANVADALSAIASDFDCGVILTHHERKSGAGEDGEKMSAGRGSTVLEGVVATMENFEVARGGDFRELTWSKVRYGGGYPLLPIRMEWQPGDWWYKHVAVDDLEQTVLNELANADPEAMTMKDLCEASGETESRIRRALKRLTEDDSGSPAKVKVVPSERGAGLRYRLVAPSTGGAGDIEF